MLRITLLCVPLLWVGCVEGVVDDADAGEGLSGKVSGAGGEGGGLSGQVGGGEGGAGGMGGLPQPVQGGAGGEPETPPPVACQPGERVGLCALCSEGGEPIAAGDDAECEIDCGGATYQRAEEGNETLCFRMGNAPGVGGRCKDVGQCFTAEEWCEAGDEAREEVLRTGPCQMMEGCLGVQEPGAEDRLDGSACPGGECLEGECVEMQPCAQFVDAIQLCTQGAGFCELFVRAEQGEMSCRQYCQRYDLQCLRAWGDDDDTCNHSSETSCDQQHSDHICRCGV